MIMMKLPPLEQVFKHHTHIVKTGIFPRVFTSNQLIHIYSKHGFLREAQNIFDKMPERNVFTWNAIIYAHILNHDMSQARCLFDSAPLKNSVTYNSMISAYANTPGFEPQALKLLSTMQQTGTQFDEFTLTTMLTLTANLSVLLYGKQLHSYMLKTANHSNPFPISSLIHMYSKCGCFSDALQVFRGGRSEPMNLVCNNAMVAACCRQGEMEMASQLFWTLSQLNDTVSWNTLISGYAQNGCLREAFGLFIRMEENGNRWNAHTFTSILSACSSLRSQKHGRQVHAWVIKIGLSSNPYISSGIVDMYCKCDNILYAELVNASTGTENAFSITSLIVGHSSKGNTAKARKLFDSLNDKNLVVWTALFSGYVRVRQCEAVFELFLDFNKEAQVPHALILVSVLGACAIQAALHSGKQIHTYILRMGIDMDDKLTCSLVDMYAKCGEINYADNIFRQAPSRDRVMYNAMMAGYAHHGYENETIELYEEMLEKKMKPDVITFVALLSACRHAGLNQVAEKYFASMKEDYGILPEIDHYSCMLDLYGRTNCLDKAMELMKKIPVEPDAVIWGTFLNACKTNESIKMVREAEEKLLRIEANNGARYVQLANVYAAEGNWSEMCRIRGKMRGGDVRKLAGCSWVYTENGINIFTSGDRSHSQAEAIYSTLSSLNIELRKIKHGPS